MTGCVLRVFRHEHNSVEVARQEWELAKEAYMAAMSKFSSLNPESIRYAQAARERQNRAWDTYWMLVRGY